MHKVTSFQCLPLSKLHEPEKVNEDKTHLWYSKWEIVTQKTSIGYYRNYCEISASQQLMDLFAIMSPSVFEIFFKFVLFFKRECELLK